MKIISWNINGLRSLVKKDFFSLPDSFWPEIICFQEVRANSNQIPADFYNTIKAKGYEWYLACGKKAGYSGVGILIKNNIAHKYTEGTKEIKFDDEGRLQQIETDHFILLNGYYPNGGRDLSRVDFKLEFSNLVLEMALSLKKKKNKPIILTGDFNTAHHPIDLANPKSNDKNTGFLPIERAFIDKLIDYRFIDCFRYFYPETPHAYTWWSQRFGCREKNIGWRLDYFFCSQELIENKNVKTCEILPNIMGSDHCPVELTLD